MRTEIWDALIDAKFTQTYTEMTCQYYRKVSRSINVFTVIFSGGGGIMGLALWKQGPLLPVIACFLTVAVQSLKHISPKLFPTDKDYRKMDKVIAFYHAKYIELHSLWLQFESDEITEAVARKEYFDIEKKDKTILADVNEVLTDDKKRRILKATKETTVFIKNKFKN